jgi:putative ATP-dependent endonuclease of the OLD family
MFIRELTIENFKGFKGKHEFKFSKNLVFFVGDNNTGKSSVFESIDFLKTGLPSTKNLKDVKNKNSADHVAVTVKLQENIKSVITDFSEAKYMKYVFEEDNQETILARRTSEVSKVKQGNKDVELNIKKITLWNPETKQFENPSGIDTVFKTLFETQFIWADTSPDDVTDFGSTKICGRLLTGAIGNFFDSQQWGEFTEVHEKTFHSGKDSLTSRTKDLEKQIQNIISDQYGAANISFNFQLPEVTSFIKSGGINIDDGTDTSSKDKGTGMQRALALALIQVYADTLSRHPEDPSKTKPLFLFIDEPETFLHPKAQHKLLEALNKISEIRQVFVTTHSPYLLQSFNKGNHMLYTFSNKIKTNQASPSNSLALFGNSSPTWGEINYFAYDLCSVEFHNELYGFVQAKAISIDEKNEKIRNFDEYLNTFGIPSDLDWIHEKVTGDETYKVTSQTYVRNCIHHPENKKNAPFSQDQLKISIEKLIDVLKAK